MADESHSPRRTSSATRSRWSSAWCRPRAEALRAGDAVIRVQIADAVETL